MAEDKVKFTVEGKGKNLKKTAKEAAKVGEAANRAGEGLDKADKAGGRYHRTQKGVAGATANSTKAFSKMQQGMGGSSGLVGAYATLAANVFAATAAFNALRQAAQMETMIEGLNAVGAAAGRNLPYAAERLREISGAALSAEASIRVMSLGISAGFRTDQMERLTKVARGASLALGRDMTDALDRLTRGTAKLEPEILDELGIMVRLDDATLKYATTLGKSVQDLTQYERRQAFLNETLDQGEKKFGQLAEKIDVNPYDQLSAALNDLAKAGLTVVNDFLGPLINLFVTNQKALIATLILFGTSIFKHMLPGLNSSAQAMANSAKATATDAKMKLQNLKVTQKLPKGYRDAVRAMQEGGLTQAKYQAGLTSLNKSMGQHLGIQARNTQGSAQEVAAYKATTIAIAEVTAAKQRLIVAYQMEQVAQAKKIAANGVELLSQGALITGTKAVASGIFATSASYWAAAASGGVFAKSMAVVKIAITGVITVLRGAVAILMGPWGIALAIVGGLIYTFWEDIKEFFGIGTKQIKRNSDEAVAAMKQVGEVGEAFSETLEKAGQMDASVMVAGFTALNGVIQETQSHLKRLAEISRNRHRDNIAALEVEITKNREQISIIDKAGKNWADKMHPEAKLRHWFGNQEGKAEIEAEITELEAQIQRFKDNFERILKEDKIRVVETMLEESKTSEAFEKFAGKELAQIRAALDKFSAGSLNAEQFDAEIERIRTPLATVTTAFETAQDVLANFNKETNKLAQKDTTPFDKALDAAKVLKDTIADVNNSAGTLGLDKERAQMLMDEIKEQLGAKGLGIGNFGEWYNDLEKVRDRLADSKSQIKKLQSEQKRLNDIQGKFPMTQQMSIKMSEKQEQIRKAEQQALEDTLTLQEGLAATELARLRVARDDLEGKKGYAAAQEAVNTAQAEFDARTIALRTQLTTKINEQVGEEEKLLKSRVDNLEIQEALLKVTNEQARAEVKILELGMRRKRAALELANLSDPTRVRAIGGAITPQQEFALAKQNRDVKMEVIRKNTKMMVDEAKLAKVRVKLETELQVLKLNVMLKQKDLTEGEEESIRAIITQTNQLATMQIRAAELRIDAAEREGEIAELLLNVEERRLGIAGRRGVVSAAGQGDTTADRIVSGGFALKDLAKSTDSYVAARKAAESRAQKEIADLRKSGVKGVDVLKDKDLFNLLGYDDTIENMVNKWTEASVSMKDAMQEAFSSLDIGQKFTLLANSMQPLIDGFRELGPEGIAVANGMDQARIGTTGVFNSMAVMKENSTTLSDAIGSLTSGSIQEMQEGMIGASGATAVAAGSAQALFATQKMGSDVAIARLDQEIAMEKKRDGQSQASLQRIKKMEAQKDKLNRKAFEQDKKAKIAGAVMAGAMAIMQAWALNPIAGAIMTPIIAAITAMQVGIISSMSYQGGGGKGVGGGPSKVTVGDRSNKVDVAGSRPGGELAYMRGGRGMGESASDFTRHGFVGAKYRAVGGAAYVVGEQGPEVIVPEAPGRIIPNDELAAGGAPINATFNINTIDATNMEQTLVSQRGNIIGMIREAANNQGQTFLEGLDTMALGDD